MVSAFPCRLSTYIPPPPTFQVVSNITKPLFLKSLSVYLHGECTFSTNQTRKVIRKYLPHIVDVWELRKAGLKFRPQISFGKLGDVWDDGRLRYLNGNVHTIFSLLHMTDMD